MIMYMGNWTGDVHAKGGFMRYIPCEQDAVCRNRFETGSILTVYDVFIIMGYIIGTWHNLVLHIQQLWHRLGAKS